MPHVTCHMSRAIHFLRLVDHILPRILVDLLNLLGLVDASRYLSSDHIRLWFIYGRFTAFTYSDHIVQRFVVDLLNLLGLVEVG